jgi:hypothetical protein
MGFQNKPKNESISCTLALLQANEKVDKPSNQLLLDSKEVSGKKSLHQKCVG